MANSYVGRFFYPLSTFFCLKTTIYWKIRRFYNYEYFLRVDFVLFRYSDEFPNFTSSSNLRKRRNLTSYAREAQERIHEFARLQRARYLLDAISLAEELLSEGSDVEILSLSRIILKRLQMLGSNFANGNFSNFSVYWLQIFWFLVVFFILWMLGWNKKFMFAINLKKCAFLFNFRSFFNFASSKYFFAAFACSKKLMNVEICQISKISFHDFPGAFWEKKMRLFVILLCFCDFSHRCSKIPWMLRIFEFEKSVSMGFCEVFRRKMRFFCYFSIVFIF